MTNHSEARKLIREINWMKLRKKSAFTTNIDLVQNLKFAAHLRH